NMLPMDELSPCIYRTNHMEEIIAPTLTPKIITFVEKQKQKKDITSICYGFLEKRFRLKSTTCSPI
ncbi:hypothetical protein EAY16_24335, partial [Vibrio anguillarum]